MSSNEKPILGLPEMDEQHTYLYKLFDLLPDVTSAAKSPSLDILLTEIERYISFHFSCEEHLMRLYEFSGFAVHQSDHEQAASRFVRFLDDYEAGSLNCAALRIFLNGWLMQHSSMSDTEYAQWIAAKRKLVCSGH